MRIGGARGWMGWIGAALLALAPGANALSLAEVVADGGFTAGNGTVFSNFMVFISGGLTDDLSAYELEITEDGFYLTGDDVGGSRRGRARGRIKLSYDVGNDGVGGLLDGSLSLVLGESSLQAKKELLLGRARIAKLLVDSRRGELEASAALGYASIHVVEKITLSDGFGGGKVGNSFSAVPEPSTLVLLAAGLGATALARRRRA